MKRYLLPKEGRFYKANLHTHTNMSDGYKTPEEVKAIYKAKGYSVVAYTDHNTLLPHSDLADDTFLPLHGVELDVNEEIEGAEVKEIMCCHIGLISLSNENVEQPCWHREWYLYANSPKYKHMVKFDETQPDYIRRYTPEGVSEIMKIAREKGYFVILNHPVWNNDRFPAYSQFDGMHAIEMFNGSAIIGGYEDYNPRVYDELLRCGKRIYCVGADDNHNSQPETSHGFDSGIGYTVIKAPHLDYPSIAQALLNGDFYASEGPEIYELWEEDGDIHLKCSPAMRIIVTKNGRRASHIMCSEDQTVNEFSFRLTDEDKYFRITVVDKQGKHACTNAYFTDEMK